ncbi:hypothetical protein G7046_g8321 [Stylonectria norvegica]|nr:hypothetical protein G7046_g8321 [Stylonectria norvegica]
MAAVADPGGHDEADADHLLGDADDEAAHLGEEEEEKDSGVGEDSGVHGGGGGGELRGTEEEDSRIRRTLENGSNSADQGTQANGLPTPVLVHNDTAEESAEDSSAVEGGIDGADDGVIAEEERAEENNTWSVESFSEGSLMVIIMATWNLPDGGKGGQADVVGFAHFASLQCFAAMYQEIPWVSSLAVLYERVWRVRVAEADGDEAQRSNVPTSSIYTNGARDRLLDNNPYKLAALANGIQLHELASPSGRGRGPTGTKRGPHTPLARLPPGGPRGHLHTVRLRASDSHASVVLSLAAERKRGGHMMA